jgi:hypothetical protein
MKKYYAVVYFKSGDINVSRPFDTEEECVAKMKRAVERNFSDVEATTYMVREEPKHRLFGDPRSRDLMKDKKFIKEITNGNK